MNKLNNITVLTLYCLLIFWLSSQSVISTPMFFEHQDKVHHMGAYFIMGMLTWRFFKDYIISTMKLSIVTLCFCSIYGLSDEWHQSFVPGRYADIMDWLADTLGATIAIISLYLTKIKLKTKGQTG